jgi:aspartyl-tRNA(Asn)/glutamyl-tRNA(Gln) amidotransferase subunit A
MTITTLSCREMHQQLQTRQLTSTELTKAYLQNIEQKNPQYNAFITTCAKEALESAAAIDAKRANGESVGLLAGMPIAIKDNICTNGIKTTCASKMLQNFIPPYDATVIEKIKAADGVVLGKVNMDEFAMGSSTEHSAMGPSKNPWNTAYVPGGSSGGTASAVGGQLAPFGLGSDTGGSIRQPAAFCGIVGLKPTYGRVSRYGLVAFASSLDQIGPMSTDVYGSSLLFDVISGYDRHDSTSINEPATSTLATLDEPLKGMKIGIVPEHMGLGISESVKKSMQESMELYKSLGAELVNVELPHGKYAVAIYYLIAPSEASSNLSRYDGVHYGYRAEGYSNLLEMYCKTRGEGFGAEVKRRIMLGTYALSAGYYDAYYLKALKVRRLVSQDFDKIFNQVDFLLSPVTPTPAFKFGEHMADPMTMYLADIYTISANLAGIPAISVPCGLTSDNMPLGIQLMGRPMSEERLLRAARMFELAANWKQKVIA